MFAYRVYRAAQSVLCSLFFAVPHKFQYSVLRVQVALGNLFPRYSRLRTLALRLHAKV